MADFYSALSCNSCCAVANTDGISIVLCCEDKQPCCDMGRRRNKRCCKKKHRKH